MNRSAGSLGRLASSTARNAMSPLSASSVTPESKTCLRISDADSSALSRPLVISSAISQKVIALIAKPSWQLEYRAGSLQCIPLNVYWRHDVTDDEKLVFQ